MKTAGILLKEAREKKNWTLQHISSRTKIKEKFLEALETSNWNVLPDFPITQGFARSYAQTVDINPKFVVAILRRDFPQKRFSPIESGFSLTQRTFWTPRTTILAAVSVTIFILGIYLFKQYMYFVAAPSLSIAKVETQGENILISGKTSPAATVLVNDRPVLVEDDGTFETKITKQDLLNSEVVVKSTSRTGKTTTIQKQVSD